MRKYPTPPEPTAASHNSSFDFERAITFSPQQDDNPPDYYSSKYYTVHIPCTYIKIYSLNLECLCLQLWSVLMAWVIAGSLPTDCSHLASVRRFLVDDMEELDEESCNYTIFCARTFAVLLLVVIIGCLAAGVVYEKLLVLAGIVAALLIVVLVLSFLDCNCFISTTVYRDSPQRRQQDQSNHGSAIQTPLQP
jgi:hypothetical protein